MRKTRTQRRHAEAAAQAQANAKNGAKGAKVTAKPVVKPAAKPVAKTPTKPAKPVENAAAQNHDDEYDQVRAADRLRRRRVAKR